MRNTKAFMTVESQGRRRNFRKPIKMNIVKMVLTLFRYCFLPISFPPPALLGLHVLLVSLLAIYEFHCH